MTITEQIITILVVIAGTMFTRFIAFIVFPEGKKPPKFISYLGSVLPYAVTGLLVVFCLKDAFHSKHYGIPELATIGLIYAIHKLKRNTLLSIASGTIIYMVFVQTLFK